MTANVEGVMYEAPLFDAEELVPLRAALLTPEGKCCVVRAEGVLGVCASSNPTPDFAPRDPAHAEQGDPSQEEARRLRDGGRGRKCQRIRLGRARAGLEAQIEGIHSQGGCGKAVGKRHGHTIQKPRIGLSNRSDRSGKTGKVADQLRWLGLAIKGQGNGVRGDRKANGPGELVASCGEASKGILAKEAIGTVETRADVDRASEYVDGVKPVVVLSLKGDRGIDRRVQ